MAATAGGVWLALSGWLAQAAAIGDICSPGHKSEGSCMVDGTGCSGDAVEFPAFVMNVSRWDSQSKTALAAGHITSYAIKGRKETWEMYLHGPHIHARERRHPEEMPPVYVFATFMNKIYRFDNFSKPGKAGEPLRAVQKVVGHALAPSTGYIFDEDADTLAPQGMLVAEGQPFWVSNLDTWPIKEIYAGGVQYLPSVVKDTSQQACTQIFPTDAVQRRFGKVVNTVDCHRGTGVCFFSVWKFYDDQFPIWNRLTQLFANDCLYYCIVGRDPVTGYPECIKTSVVVDEHGKEVCHVDGVGAVHGFTVGKTDPVDPTQYDLFLVFTGKATMTNGESSMKKVRVRVTGKGDARELEVLRSAPFAIDLFEHYAPKGWDVGGDHAWVDETGKYVWVSCFREKGLGIHMLDYETGELLYSVTGLNDYVPNQYTYTSGIHGVGTLGKRGSYLVVATCSCHSLEVCIPTVPWRPPVPESVWSVGVLFVVDLASAAPSARAVQV